VSARTWPLEELSRTQWGDAIYGMSSEFRRPLASVDCLTRFNRRRPVVIADHGCRGSLAVNACNDLRCDNPIAGDVELTCPVLLTGTQAALEVHCTPVGSVPSESLACNCTNGNGNRGVGFKVVAGGTTERVSGMIVPPPQLSIHGKLCNELASSRANYRNALISAMPPWLWQMLRMVLAVECRTAQPRFAFPRDRYCRWSWLVVRALYAAY
jgi:hypothetical protein